LIVSELVVVIAVCGLSLVLTGLHAVRISRAGATPHDLERLLAAVQRACADFLWQETRALGLLVGIVLVVLAGALVLFGAFGGGHASAAWSLAALCVGALAGAAVAHFAHRSGARTTHGALGALRQDRGAATLVALRGASVLGMLLDSASSGLSVLFFCAQYAYLTAIARVAPLEAALLASRSLAALAFGALCAAVVFQVGGASLHTAAGVAATGVRARNARAARDEEQNPVLVAELVGHHVGGIVSRSTDAFAGLLLANGCLVMLAALVGSSNPSSGVSALAWVALPLVIRALGQLAASIALGSSRFEGHPGPREMLVAARLSHALMILAAVFGAALWLIGQPLYSRFVLPAALGVFAGVVSAGASLLSAGRQRPGALRSAPSVARAFGLGLQRTWLLFLLVGACLGAAWVVGARTPLVHGGAFALTLAVAALLGAGSFNASESVFGMVCENVLRLAGLRRSRFDDAAKSRAVEMDRVGSVIGHQGHTQIILSGAAASLLAAVSLPLLNAPQAPEAGGVGLAHPVVLLGGVLGAGSLLFHVGGMLKASSRAAGSLDRDLTDRLTREAESGATRGPLPGYRDSVQLATTSATQALLPLALGAVLVPFVVSLIMRLVYGAGGGAVAVYGLMAFSALGTLTGCCAALLAQETCLELAEARRTNADAETSTHSVIEFMERCIGPAALLGLKVTVVSSLTAVPLLF
jgi:Na+/H+-translocating membrane pyrophosphatase